MQFKHFFAVIAFLSAGNIKAQTIIHSHNDYLHEKPFWDAFNNKAGIIEADVFYINGKLMVAHSKGQINMKHTLSRMYIKPILSLFKKENKKVYPFYLMIDIKESPDEVIGSLIKIAKKYPGVFNREVNKNAVQVFISGERPPDTSFHSFPSFIMFDGLPMIKYRQQDLNKIVIISDDFHKYSSWNGKGILPATDSIRLVQMISNAHAEGKPVRFWGAPDTKECWATLIRLHADVINTDKVKECRQFLNNHQQM